jgi:hypothetical protein
MIRLNTDPIACWYYGFVGAVTSRKAVDNATTVHQFALDRRNLYFALNMALEVIVCYPITNLKLIQEAHISEDRSTSVRGVAITFGQLDTGITKHGVNS